MPAQLALKGLPTALSFAEGMWPSGPTWGVSMALPKGSEVDADGDWLCADKRVPACGDAESPRVNRRDAVCRPI